MATLSLSTSSKEVLAEIRWGISKWLHGLSRLLRWISLTAWVLWTSLQVSWVKCLKSFTTPWSRMIRQWWLTSTHKWPGLPLKSSIKWSRSRKVPNRSTMVVSMSRTRPWWETLIRWCSMPKKCFRIWQWLPNLCLIPSWWPSSTWTQSISTISHSCQRLKTSLSSSIRTVSSLQTG